MIAYKVFSKVEGRLFSANKKVNSSSLSQEYFLSEVNYPKFSNPIFCFKLLSAAQKFRFYNGLNEKNSEIWTVEGDIFYNKVVFYPAYAITNEFSDFFHISYNERASLPTIPEDTIYMDKITLISREE